MIATSPAFLLFGSWTTLDVVNHLWQSTVAGLAVLGLLLAGASLSARTRRALGLMALVKFVVPIAALGGLVTRFGGAPEHWLVSPAFTLPASLSPGSAVSAPPVATSWSAVPTPPQATWRAQIPFGRLLAVAWVAGFVVIFGRWGLRGWRLRRRILALAQPVSAAIAQCAAGAAARAGLRAVPRCATVGDTPDVGVLGGWSPIVILPRGIEDTLTAAELEMVLIHEFVHVQRRDNLWGAVQYFLASLFWFHPLVWLLHCRIGLEAEQACDERVLELTGNPEVYAGGIVKCVRHALGVAQPGLAGVATPPVVARLKNILAYGRRQDRPLVRVAALVAGATVLGFSGCAGSFANRTVPVATPPAPVVPPAAPVPARTPNTVMVYGERPVPRYQYNQQTGVLEVNGFDFRQTLAVDFADEEIVTIVRTIANAANLNIVVPDTLRGKKATLSKSGQTWQEIFRAILGPAGHAFVEDGDIVKIFAGTQRPIRRPSELGIQKSTPARETLSVDFPDEDIRRLLANVAELFALDVIMPDALQGRTTIRLRHMTWRRIFQLVLEPAGYTFVEDGNKIRIVPKESVGGGER